MSDDVSTAFVLFQEALDLADEPDQAVTRVEQVVAIQRANGGDLATEDADLPFDMTLSALAELYQQLERWADLRDVTAELRAIAPFQGSAHTAHSIALKQLGDPEGARAALERGIAVAPTEVNPRVELACQRLGAGDRAGAFEAIGAAMERGAEPEALRAVPDLEPLLGDPRLDYLLGRDNHVQCLAKLLVDEHAELASTAPAADDEEALAAWADDDDTLDSIDDGVDLAERLLEAAEVTDVPTLPPDPGGEVLVDTSQCNAAQLRAIDAVLACEHYWRALPFAIVLAASHIPATSPTDARERLGLG